jgi:hypothetical protein
MEPHVQKRLSESSFLSIADGGRLGENVKLPKFINLYGCALGSNTKIGTFVEIPKMLQLQKIEKFKPFSHL